MREQAVHGGPVGAVRAPAGAVGEVRGRCRSRRFMGGLSVQCGHLLVRWGRCGQLLVQDLSLQL